MDALPKSAQPGARKAIQDIYNAESAQQRWRAVNAPHLVALVRAGARFERGQLAERSETRIA